MHKKFDFQIDLESRPAEGDKVRMAFRGLKTGRKKGFLHSGARTVKTNPETTRTSKHMLNFKEFPID